MRSASVPFSIPADSPLASGWRAAIAAALERYGVHEVLDAVSAYAELRCRHEPDNCSAAEESALGTWFKLREPALRRIEAVEIPAGPGRPRIEETV